VWGSVSSVTAQRDGLQRLDVVPDVGERAAAISYPALSGPCVAGDRVLLNTTAVDLSLGTGGAHVVVARASAHEGAGASTHSHAGAHGIAFDDPSGGHVMKLRYTPLQLDVMAVEAPESPSHSLLEDATDLAGMPVVCCGLHSQVPLVAAAIKERRPAARIAYVMTDQAALPFALSDVIAACTEAGLLDVTVSCGQAFGAAIEAVNLPSGLIAARLVGVADAAIVAMGPGGVGTSTELGHSGVAQGEAVNACAAVGARAVASLRISFADTRERHRGVSHHTVVALTRVALAEALVAVPVLGAAEQARVDADLEAAGVWDRHERRDVECGLPDVRGVDLRSMGRTPDGDPAFFLAATAAGAVAASLL
jgi:hypothetical protein